MQNLRDILLAHIAIKAVQIHPHNQKHILLDVKLLLQLDLNVKDQLNLERIIAGNIKIQTINKII